MNLAISFIDVVIIGCYLLATVLFGMWTARRHANPADFFLGGRQLPWWALLISIVATETSTVTFLSVPGLAFKTPGGNFFFLQLAVGYIVGRFAAAWLLLPSYFQGSLFTSYELLQRRYNATIRRLTSLLFLASRNLGDALRLFLTALVLHNVIAVDMPTCVIAIGVATIVYTFAGGLRSVVWNDCVQFAVYMIGAVWALVVLLERLPGGWEELREFAENEGKFRMFDFTVSLTADHLNFVIGLLGGAFLTLSTHGTDQMIVQRLLGARRQLDAAKALVLSGLVVFLQFALFLLIGVALACFYDRYPPERVFAGGDEVFAGFIVDHLGVGVVGIILAAIFAAAMSTQSSSLNSSASAAINDFYVPLRGGTASDSQILWAGRVATVVFGIVQIALAIGCGEFSLQRSTVDNVLKIAAFTNGPILGLFLLAVFRRTTSGRAGLVGFVCGLLVLTLILLASDVNGYCYTMIGSLVTVTAGLLVEYAGKFETPAR